MSNSYEEAVRLWGIAKLRESGYGVDDAAIVTVDFEFNEGYACCGGRDPDCYCSFAESPSASIAIKSGHMSYEISSYSFDFVEILNEIGEYV